MDDFERDGAARVDALRRYGLLDGAADEELDELAQAAAEVCEAPLAAVTFLTETRQILTARVGLDEAEFPARTSICRHALAGRDAMVVPDLHEDERFRDPATVNGGGRLRFYAGVPLFSDEGVAFGTLCVFDERPRQLDEHALRLLKVLARQATTRIELRRALAENEEQLRRTRFLETRYRQIVDSAVDIGIVTLELDGTVSSFNTGAARLTGRSEAEMLGRPIAIVHDADDRIAGAERRMNAIPPGDEHDAERWILRRDGSRFPASVETMPLRADDGVHVGYLEILRDRTPEYEAEQRRGELMHEMSHRMKNVLATVQSIVSQSLRSARSVRDGQDAIASRLHALARAQDMLTLGSWTGADIRRVIEDSLAAHTVMDADRVTVEGPAMTLSSQQVLGLTLALHELATNASKYGAWSDDAGHVAIRWSEPSQTGAGFFFEWRESGGPPVTPPEHAGFGSRLVQRIVGAYFDGEGALDFAPEGVRFTLTGKPGARAQ